jgi:hypothetical protein
MNRYCDFSGVLLRFFAVWVLLLSAQCNTDSVVEQDESRDIKRVSSAQSAGPRASARTGRYLQGAPKAQSNPKKKHILDKNRLSHGERKLSTDLLNLVRPDLFSTTDLPKGLKSVKPLIARGPSVKAQGASIEVAADVVYVYIYLKKSASINAVDEFLSEITRVDEKNKIVVAYVEVARLSSLAEQDAVRVIRPVAPPEVDKVNVTEGDAIHRSDLVRTTFPDGSGEGMTVGVISDGVDSRSAAQSTGDLPADGAGLTVLSNTQGGDEGTAMLEIVYDIVPAAELYFHDRDADVLGFNDAIDNLVAAGCNVIVDDINWSREPFFELGTIASHVADVLAAEDIIYISSAGNTALRHHQKVFTDNGSGYHRAATDPAATYPYLYANIPKGGTVFAILQWNEPFGSSGQDYDLHVADVSGGAIYLSSTNIQNGNDDPLEYIGATYNGNGSIDVSFLIEKSAASGNAILEVYMYGYDGAFIYSNNTTAPDSIFGHKAVPGVLAVGAIGADDSGYDDIESFSSQGPVTLMSGIIQKPDICGMDGVSVTGAGGFSSPFYGTSAAAPHIAAIAAQLWGKDPSLDRDTVISHLLNNTVDLGTTGFDTVFGHGRADAYDAFVDIGSCTRDSDCDDNVFCNGAETCNVDTGQCENSSNPCGDDGLYCNGTESCDENGNRCVNSGNPCGDDGLYCNGTESCDENGNRCVSSGNPCVDDGLYCDGTESCDENGNRCVSSGNPCDASEICEEQSERCVTSCDGCLIDEVCYEDEDTNPSNPCEGCDVSESDTHWSDNDGESCDDGDPCTESDECVEGACVPGVDKDCDDDDVCTTDSCDSSTGECDHEDNDASCDDDAYCNGSDTCSSGTCEHSGNPCDDPEVCDEESDLCATSCDGCLIDEVCYGDDDVNPFNPCEVCDVSESDTQWSDNDGESCEDGDICTLNDICDKGLCTAGIDKSCIDGNVCTTDSCESSTGECNHENNTAPCDDGDPCSTEDVCFGGVCVAGKVADSDGDGASNCGHGCPNNPNKTDAGPCGCDAGDIDSNGDGIPDCKGADDHSSHGSSGCTVVYSSRSSPDATGTGLLFLLGLTLRRLFRNGLRKTTRE